MRKILLDGKEVTSLETESLPMLIHGKEGSGASLYTICLAVKWFIQGNEVLFLCGYPMAEEEFDREVGREHEKAKFYTKENVNKFVEALKSASDNTIIFIKNVELFDDSLFTAIESTNNIVVSGDVEKSTIKNKILAKSFITEIYFSPLEGKKPMSTRKYQGYVVSDEYRGITSLAAD